MAKHAFLSQNWIEEARRLRKERAGDVKPSAPPVRMNLVVTGVPDGPPQLNAHLDTTAGKPEIDLGHLDGAETTVTVDYALAKTVFVDGNLGAAMEGLQLGRVKVNGDMMKLMSLATVSADPDSIALTRAVREMTE